jgi:hypothetical protein
MRSGSNAEVDRADRPVRGGRKPRPEPVAVVEYPAALIGVDPGGTTGVAVYTVEDGNQPAELKDVLQLTDPDSVATDLCSLGLVYAEQHYNIRYVVEQFDNRPGVVNPDFTPKYVIRDIKNAIPEEYIQWQTPSQAKNLVKPSHNGTSDGLKRFGWYQTKFRHANDASRHVIVYLVERLKHKPTILKGWPKRG